MADKNNTTDNQDEPIVEGVLVNNTNELVEEEQKQEPETPPLLNAGSSATKKPVTSDEPSSTKTNKSHRSMNQPERNEKPKVGLIWFAILLTWFVLGAGVAGVYWLEQQKLATLDKATQTNSEQQTQIASLSNENGTLRSELNAGNQKAQEMANEFAALKENFQALQQQNAVLQDLYDGVNGRRPSDWLIAEANYLVRMAGRKVWLEQDTRTAIMLLSNADERLSELADPSVLPIRSLIASDIQALKQVNQVAHVSIALAISGLLGQVDVLPLDTHQIPESTLATAQEMTESVNDWQHNLAVVWQNIVDDFISVERVDVPLKPLMSAQQQWLAREQLSLYLLQAQASATKAQNTLYQQSLQQALATLVKHYQLDSPEVTGFVGAIQNLTTNDVSQAVPTELSSQRPLSDLLQRRVDNVHGNTPSNVEDDEGAIAL